MPYVKSIPIRSTVNRSIAYILNPEKTDELIYVSGINCVAEKQIAAQQFKSVYQQFHEDKRSQSKGRKKTIMAHHFVQSFKQGEVTPEVAHKIAQEWAKQTFGDNRQVVISTHIDKGHVHSHFIVNAYDFDGKKYYSNKTTLKRARDLSDRISLEYGIEPIQGNMRKGVEYKEWMEIKKGTSWKQKIRIAIDKAVIQSKDFDDLLKKLVGQGFEVKQGKYISVRPKYLERFVRIHNLGEAYTEKMLRERINNKDHELNKLIDPVQYEVPKTRVKTTKGQTRQKPKRTTYKGIQLKYVSLIRLVADLIIKDQKPVRKYKRKRPYSVENDYDVNKLAAHLRLLNKENITTESELHEKEAEVESLFKDTKASLDKMAAMEESLNGVIKNSKVYFELKNKENISSSDKLKITVAHGLIKKYNINQVEDLIKLEKERDKINKNRIELMERYKQTEKRYRDFKDLVSVYNKINNNTYLDEIQRRPEPRDKSR